MGCAEESRAAAAVAATQSTIERRAVVTRGGVTTAVDARELVPGRGLHSLTPELNLRTFGTHRSLQSLTSTLGTYPRVNLGHMGDKVSYS